MKNEPIVGACKHRRIVQQARDSEAKNDRNGNEDVLVLSHIIFLVVPLVRLGLWRVRIQMPHSCKH